MVYFHHKFSAITWRASNERPYWIVETITILRSGIICFLTLQTIFPNWVRRLAVRASNERPYWIVRTITILRLTIIFHFQFYARSGIICFLTLQTIFPNWERRLAVRASNERPYWIAKTITILRSGIIFHLQFSIFNFMHARA